MVRTGPGRIRHGRRGDPDAPVVDVADVLADDELIDRLLNEPTGPRQHTSVRDDADAELLALFVDWRNELWSKPIPVPPPPPILRPATAGAQPFRRRSLRATLAIGAAVAVLLMGFAMVGSRDARPGDALWVVASAIWTDRVESVESVHQVKAALDEARSLLRSGRSRDAHTALLRASAELEQVHEIDGRTEMRQQVDALLLAVAPPSDQPRADLPDSEAAQRAADVDDVPGVLVAAPPAPTSADPVAPAPAVADATVDVAAGSPPVVSPSAAAAPVEREPADGPADGSSDIASAPSVPGGAGAAGSSIGDVAPADPAVDDGPPATPGNPSADAPVDQSAEPSVEPSVEPQPPVAPQPDPADEVPTVLQTPQAETMPTAPPPTEVEGTSSPASATEQSPPAPTASATSEESDPATPGTRPATEPTEPTTTSGTGSTAATSAQTPATGP